MKWINLAERHPDCLGEVVARKIRGIDPVFIFKNYKYKDDGTIDVWEKRDGANFKQSDFEWLDESPQICCLYEVQAKRVHNGEITIEEYLKICFPDKFKKGYQIVQVLPGSAIFTHAQFKQLRKVLAVRLREDTGVGLMDANAILGANHLDYDKSLEYIDSGEWEKDLRRRGTMVDAFPGTTSATKRYTDKAVNHLLAEQHRNTVDDIYNRLFAAQGVWSPTRALDSVREEVREKVLTVKQRSPL